MGRLTVVARDKIEVRLKSSRAPYTRAGIDFASNRETVVRNGAEITDEQLEKLAEDTAISIEVVNLETGEAIDLAKLTAEQSADSAEGGPKPRRQPAKKAD